MLAESLMPSLIALLPNSARVMSTSAVVTITFIIAVRILSSYFVHIMITIGTN